MFGGFTFEVFGFAALSFMGAYMLLFLLYFIVLEGTFGACGIGPAVIRNVLRIVDALPFFYIIGLILISRSDKKQRLGDSLAKTVVVKSSQAQPIAAPAQAKAFCTNCGAELPGGTSFCPKCGAKQ
jgi:ribosomal protein L40E